MTMHIVPKPEPVSSGPWPDSSKSEANGRGGSTEKSTPGVLSRPRSPPPRTTTNAADDSSAPLKMTVLTAPKQEPASSGHWSDVSNPEANLRRGSEENSMKGVVPEPRPPPTTPSRTDDLGTPDEVANEHNESNCLYIVALPVIDVAAPTEAPMRENAKDQISAATSDPKSVVKDTRLESFCLSIGALPVVDVSPINVRTRENTREPRRISELDHVYGALSDAKSAIKKVGLKWKAVGNVMQEKENLKDECVERKKLLDITRRILTKRVATAGARVQELESERHATLAALDEKEAMLKGARDEIQTMHQEHDAAVADVWDQVRELEANRDAAVSELWGQKQEFQAKCKEMKREADSQCDGWQREAGNQIIEHSKEKLLLRRELHSAMELKTLFEGDLRKVLAEKQHLERNLIGVVSLLNYKTQRDEMGGGKEGTLTILTEERVKLEKEQEANRVLNAKLGNALTRKRKLEDDLACIREENNRLRHTQETVVQKLHEGHIKTLCQICCAFPKDTVPLPCLHLHFCFACLEKQYKLTKTCPSCNVPINCYMRCNIVL